MNIKLLNTYGFAACALVFIVHFTQTTAKADPELSIYLKPFTKLDRDNNGAISFNELFWRRIKGIESKFERVDRNKDGFIHSDELPKKKEFSEIDFNRDRFITFDEFSRNAKIEWKKQFETWDKDGDSFISLQEFASKTMHKGKKKKKIGATPYPDNPFGENRF